jgi:flavin reductase (DIM6/NTAB) family NADH-FMN oxidoreductase RutF
VSDPQLAELLLERIAGGTGVHPAVTTHELSSNSQGSGVAIETPISSDLFKQSMRLLAGGVCIVATSGNGEWHGLTMTAVCSLTADPPSLIACVNRDAGAHGIMSITRRVSINVLSHDHAALAELFSSPRIKGPQRFDGTKWIEMASGVPALVDALAVLDCEVVRDVAVGQHSVFFCEVRNARLQPDKRPLVHFNREFCAIQPTC